ncbi:MAG: protein-glutamate O-methyltransferase CheR [Planctomycetota bacterium]
MNVALQDQTQFPAQQCENLCESLRIWVGIDIDPSKTYLVRSRLREVLQRHNVETLGDLLNRAKLPNSEARHDIIDAMTTHETLFFRDRHPFETVAKKLVPDALLASPTARYRIHCLACSTGQEPYSLVMRLSETLRPEQLLRVELHASDVSRPTLEMARRGEYMKHELSRGLTDAQRQRFFEPVSSDSALGRMRLIDSIRQRVRFQVLNLAFIKQQRPNQTELLDLCLCRNVLIYFDDELRSTIVRGLANWIRPGGHLIIGSSEMLSGFEDVFERRHVDGTVVYQRR